MEFDPAEALRVATDLDALATRLEADLDAGAPVLAAAAPGTDEVSLRAADTLREVASSFDTSTREGVLELRRLAASLRAQARQLVGVDEANAAEFSATV